MKREEKIGGNNVATGSVETVERELSRFSTASTESFQIQSSVFSAGLESSYAWTSASEQLVQCCRKVATTQSHKECNLYARPQISTSVPRASENIYRG